MSKGVSIFVALFLGVGGVAFIAAGVGGAAGTVPIKFNERTIEGPSILAGLPFILIGLLLLAGASGFLTAIRSGVEVTEDGLTAVNYKGVRQTVYWSQITAFNSDGTYAELKTSTETVRFPRGMEWDKLANIIQSHLPAHVARTDQRPEGKSIASLSSTVFPSSSRKAMKIILIVGFIAMAVATAVIMQTRSSPQFPILIAAVLSNTALFAVVIWGTMRIQVELKSDGLTYTPRFGKPIDIAYSAIRSLRFQTHVDEGTTIEEWIISRDAGKDVRLTGLERMDELIGVLASKMPGSSTFVGRNRTSS